MWLKACYVGKVVKWSQFVEVLVMLWHQRSFWVDLQIDGFGRNKLVTYIILQVQ